MNNKVVMVDFSKGKMTETLKVGHSRNRSSVANDQLPGRKHLTPDEIDLICQCIRRKSRYPDRDELMVLVTFYHGFRASEVCQLKWQHIQLRSMQMKVNRIKNVISTTQPIACKRELMLLRRLHRGQNKPSTGFVFRNERGHAVSVNGLQKMFGKFSEIALGTLWNFHGVRHAFCTTLIDRGNNLRTAQLMAGHKNIQNTLVYLHESAKQFENIEW